MKYDTRQLFFQNYIYLVDNSKNWLKADYLIDHKPETIDIDDNVIKAFQLVNKLELGDTRDCYNIVKYFIDNARKISNSALKDIVLYGMFNYAFIVLANECLYNKLSENDDLAMTASKAFNVVSYLDNKTYRSNIMQILYKLEQAKENNSSYTSNYILANYYMVVRPFRKKYPVLLNEIRKAYDSDAPSFILDD